MGKWLPVQNRIALWARKARSQPTICKRCTTNSVSSSKTEWENWPRSRGRGGCPRLRTPPQWTEMFLRPRRTRMSRRLCRTSNPLPTRPNRKSSRRLVRAVVAGSERARVTGREIPLRGIFSLPDTSPGTHALTLQTEFAGGFRNGAQVQGSSSSVRNGSDGGCAGQCPSAHAAGAARRTVQSGEDGVGHERILGGGRRNAIGDQKGRNSGCALFRLEHSFHKI